MTTSVEPRESKATQKKPNWSRNTWSTVHATKSITSSPEMINIINTKLNKDGKPFHTSIHKELLCYYSSYYTAALKGGFSEAKKDTITMQLPYDLMTDLVSWLYSGTIISRVETNLMDLYVFADEKMMLAFRRSIMSRLIECHDPKTGMLAAKDAMPYLNHLPQYSGLFRYLVDYWAYVWSQGNAKSGLATFDVDKRLPRTFFYQVVEKLSSMVRSNDTNAGRIALDNACNYHEHGNRSECYETCGNGVSHPNPPTGYYDVQSVALCIR